jgi:hypothetical protein
MPLDWKQLVEAKGLGPDYNQSETKVSLAEYCTLLHKVYGLNGQEIVQRIKDLALPSFKPDFAKLPDMINRRNREALPEAGTRAYAAMALTAIEALAVNEGICVEIEGMPKIVEAEAVLTMMAHLHNFVSWPEMCATILEHADWRLIATCLRESKGFCKASDAVEQQCMNGTIEGFTQNTDKDGKLELDGFDWSVTYGSVYWSRRWNCWVDMRTNTRAIHQPPEPQLKRRRTEPRQVPALLRMKLGQSGRALLAVGMRLMESSRLMGNTHFDLTPRPNPSSPRTSPSIAASLIQSTRSMVLGSSQRLHDSPVERKAYADSAAARVEGIGDGGDWHFSVMLR